LFITIEGFFYQTATFGFRNRLCPVLPCIKITVLSTFVNLYVHDYSVPAVGPGQKSEQNRTEQNRIEQNRTEQNRTELKRPEQNRKCLVCIKLCRLDVCANSINNLWL